MTVYPAWDLPNWGPAHASNWFNDPHREIPTSSE